LKCLVEYCELIGFEGEERTLDAYIDAISDGYSIDAMETFCKGDQYLSQCSNYEHIAKAALVLSNLALPRGRCSLISIKPLILGFTKELVKWYD
jgi:hypothetical protein